MAEPDSLFFFFFFLLLFLQLLRWVPNPPWTSGEVAGHRSDIPGRQPNAQLCIISAVMEPRVIKTQKPREKKKKKIRFRPVGTTDSNMV